MNARRGGLLKQKVIAAAWGVDETLHVLLARGAVRKTAVVRDGRTVDVNLAVPKANRLVVLADGSVLTANVDGKTKLVTAEGETVHGNLEQYVFDIVVCHGGIYAGCNWRTLAEWHDSRWFDTGLDDALKVLLKKYDESVGHVHSVVSGARGPIVAVRLDDSRKNLLMEHDGKKWRRRATLDVRVNAIAWAPRTNTVFTVGDDIFAVDAKGKSKRVPNPGDDERDHWSAAWVGNRLLVGTLDAVEAIDVTTGRTKTVLAATKGEVPHNHSLFASGTAAAFVRDGRVFTLKGERMVPTRLTAARSA